MQAVIKEWVNAKESVNQEEEVPRWGREEILLAREESLKRREEMVAYREEMVREREAAIKRRSVLWHSQELERDERNIMGQNKKEEWMDRRVREGSENKVGENESEKKKGERGSGKRWLEHILNMGNGSGRKLRKRRSAFR